jgi:hypothetical protein
LPCPFEVVVIFADYTREGLRMEWISVKDKLPAHYENVFIYPLPEFSDEYRYVGEYDIVKESFVVWIGSLGEHEKVYVTHWRPMHEPPKAI